PAPLDVEEHPGHPLRDRRLDRAVRLHGPLQVRPALHRRFLSIRRDRATECRGSGRCRRRRFTVTSSTRDYLNHDLATYHVATYADVGEPDGSRLEACPTRSPPSTAASATGRERPSRSPTAHPRPTGRCASSSSGTRRRRCTTTSASSATVCWR